MNVLTMVASRTTARLYLNGEDVGTVHVRGWEHAWGFGDFEPGEGFTRYAPLYGRWSLLMHADDGDEKMNAATLEELRQTEREIDRVRARLFIAGARDGGEWRTIRQLNIDGSLIEWKED